MVQPLTSTAQWLYGLTGHRLIRWYGVTLARPDVSTAVVQPAQRTAVQRWRADQLRLETTAERLNSRAADDISTRFPS